MNLKTQEDIEFDTSNIILEHIDSFRNKKYLNLILETTIENLMSRFEINAEHMEDICCDIISKEEERVHNEK